MSTGNQKLTPQGAIEALEKRFALGQVTHADVAWNAQKNWEQLDKEFWILDRINHGLQHLSHYQGVLFGMEDNGDDDGAAIMWLGCMLHCAYERRKAKANGSKP